MKDWLKRFGGAMDWPSNVSGRGKISDPFGDWDKDGVPNMNDCSPRNPRKQDKMTSRSMAQGFLQQEMKLNRSQPESQVKIPGELRQTKAITLPVLPGKEIPVKIGIPKDPLRPSPINPTPAPIRPTLPGKEIPVKIGIPKDPDNPSIIKPVYPRPGPTPPGKEIPVKIGIPKDPGVRNFPMKPSPFGPTYYISSDKIISIYNNPQTPQTFKNQLSILYTLAQEKKRLLSQPAYDGYDRDVQAVSAKIKAEANKLDTFNRTAITGTAW